MKQKIGTVLSSFLWTLATPVILHAKGLNDATDRLNYIAGESGVKKTDVGTVMGTVIATALSLVGIIFLALMVYAGYLWMTARGESSQIEKAQEIIKASLIGIVIVLSAYAITAFVMSKFGSL